MSKCGIVVPTKGDRPQYLAECLKSIQAAGFDVVTIVSPEDLVVPDLSGVRINHKSDPGQGAAAAINIGLAHLIEEESCDAVAWLGDDDSLMPDSLQESLARLEETGSVAVVGPCHYVDGQGSSIYLAQPRPRDICLLEYWSNRIPQPGALFSSDALVQVGYLDSSLKYAFDQDLFHRLKSLGTISITKSAVAKYRWHSGSLSSSGRIESALESQKLRLKYGHRSLQGFTVLWFWVYRVLSRWIPSTLP